MVLSSIQLWSPGSTGLVSLAQIEMRIQVTKKRDLQQVCANLIYLAVVCKKKRLANSKTQSFGLSGLGNPIVCRIRVQSKSFRAFHNSGQYPCYQCMIILHRMQVFESLGSEKKCSASFINMHPCPVQVYFVSLSLRRTVEWIWLSKVDRKSRSNPQMVLICFLATGSMLYARALLMI